MTAGSAWRSWGWNHPQWTWAAVGAAGWVPLATLDHESLRHPYSQWLVMVVAMMLPPALPMARYVALAGRWRRRQRGAACFVVGHLAVWAGVGLLAGPLTVLAGPSPRALAVATCVAAGWELTPVKRRFLRRCHRVRALPPDGIRATVACLRFGARHGCRVWAPIGPSCCRWRWPVTVAWP